MDLTVLVENFCTHAYLAGEYGMSFFLNDDKGNILIDTGQGHTLFSNASVLDIDLLQADHLVLSHGHYDHVGGASRFLTDKGEIPLWAHPEILSLHSRLVEGEGHFIGCHLNTETVDFRPVTGLTSITENVWAVEVPTDRRDPDFLPNPSRLVVPAEKDQWKPDPFPDDISLVVKGEHGLSVILGCSHAGIVNILEEVARHFKTRDFHAVIGGMHLLEGSSELIDKIVTTLVSRFQVSLWRPCHCTGFNAAATLAEKASDVTWAHVGTRLNL